jgi:nucleotide-binding universal stress UspA family protein
LKKILVPVDGSEYSFRAVQAAAALAVKFDSKITLLHVTAPPFGHYLGELDIAITMNILEEMEKEGRAILAKAEAECPEGLVDTIYRQGNPTATIVNESKKGYDLIVMGSRGLGALKEFLMGSVSNGVVHRSDCSVMIVR